MSNNNIISVPRVRRVIYDLYAAFPVTGLQVGDLAFSTDRLVLYRWSGAAWQEITVASSSGLAGAIPAAAGLPDGSLYYETDTGLLKQVSGGAWVTVTELGGGKGIFGDGSDGDVTIAGNTTLTRDMYYNDLTISAGFTLYTHGYRVFVKSALTIVATSNMFPQYFHASGKTGGAGASTGSLGGGGAGAAGTVNSGGGGGGGGGGVLVVCAKTIINAGTLGAKGGNGAAAGAQAVSDAPRVAGTNSDNSLGGNGGGVGGGAGVDGGVATAPAASIGGFHAVPMAVLLHNPDGTVVNGGAGGAAGSSDASGNNDGGGGGGGGVLVLLYNSLTNTGTISVAGGTGGAGNGTGEAGCNGVAGTLIQILCN